jgi:fructose-specific phosphotransferase system component IIB
MAIDFEVQRLQIGDVIRIELPGQAGAAEALVVRDIERAETTVRATLRVAGREDFVEEWPLGTMVTVVRGP